jgi:hypothetical protein
MRDYSSISPSAKSLLLTKGLTNIPFMEAAVNIVWGRDSLTAMGKKNFDPTFLKRLIHFEARYKSVDNLLALLGGNNILEISSGFSFRGLNSTLHHPEITYIDTDLPGVIEAKSDIINELMATQSLDLQGELLVMPMNALDEDAVNKTVAHLPAGPVNIINEGLLVYLNTDEKTKLCSTIHKILTDRGGYLITADIYIKKNIPGLSNDQFSQFLQAHNVEENKFESFEQAEEFFYARGLKIHQKAEPVFQQLSSLKYLPTHAIDELVAQAGKIGRIRETWALVPV